MLCRILKGTFCFRKQDSWTICRIFKKTSSMAQRALSHSWGPPMPAATGKDERSLLWDATSASFTFCFCELLPLIASCSSTSKSVHHQQIRLPGTAAAVSETQQHTGWLFMQGHKLQLQSSSRSPERSHHLAIPGAAITEARERNATNLRRAVCAD